MVTPTTTTTEYRMPGDIQNAQFAFSSLMEDLSDLMGIEAEEWLSDLEEAMNTWQNGGPEPDWEGFRESADDMCHDDGMPSLFSPPKRHPETAPDAHLEAMYEDRCNGGYDG